jgi:hypothetical protein
LSTSNTVAPYVHILPVTKWSRFSPSHSLLQGFSPVQLPESRRSTAAPPSPFSRLPFPAAVPRPPPQSRRPAPGMSSFATSASALVPTPGALSRFVFQRYVLDR